jgi:hypothetical protein
MELGNGDGYLPPEENEQRAMYEDIRAWAQDGLRQLAETGHWTPEAPSIAVIITKFGTMYKEPPSPDAFGALHKYAIKQLLIRQAWRVSRCARAKCGKLFIRKGRSEYCNPKCSSAERASRVYAKKKVASADPGEDANG